MVNCSPCRLARRRPLSIAAALVRCDEITTPSDRVTHPVPLGLMVVWIPSLTFCMGSVSYGRELDYAAGFTTVSAGTAGIAGVAGGAFPAPGWELLSPPSSFGLPVDSGCTTVWLTSLLASQ